MDNTEYLNKINAILTDESKFMKISKDPREALKKKLKKLITKKTILEAQAPSSPKSPANMEWATATAQ